MNEKPILFSRAMVCAILDGRKTQTRRVVKPQPSETFLPLVGRYCPTLVDKRDGEQFPGPETFGASDENEGYPCPYGQPGDRLWVKETFARVHDGLLQHLDPEPDNGEPWNNGWSSVFRADGVPAYWEHYGVHWKPSIFMPRKLSRLTLEIVAVRVERLQDISEADAIAEGLYPNPQYTHAKLYTWDGVQGNSNNPLYAYQLLWESINGAESWAANPWVWVIEFRREKQTTDHKTTDHGPRTSNG